MEGGGGGGGQVKLGQGKPGVRLEVLSKGEQGHKKVEGKEKTFNFHTHFTERVPT